MIDEIKNGKIHCMLGDRTGIVSACIDEVGFLKEGVVVFLMGVEVDMSTAHIKILTTKNSIIKQTKEQIPRINLANNVSEREFV